MRLLINFCLLLLATSSFAQDSFYGKQIDKEGIQNSDQLKLSLENNEKIDAKLKGEILETCANKGCWMTMKFDNGQEMRVTFKDYGFFVPTEGVAGNMAIIQGEVKKETTPVETLRHYAEDAGKSKAEIESITTPKEEYTFVARGVIIEMMD
jgi:hypothetical protein